MLRWALDGTWRSGWYTPSSSHAPSPRCAMTIWMRVDHLITDLSTHSYRHASSDRGAIKRIDTRFLTAGTEAGCAVCSSMYCFVLMCLLVYALDVQYR